MPPVRSIARPLCRGFTLVELLLALAIAAVVAALAWSLLSSTSRAVEREAERERAAAAALAVDPTREDLGRLVLPADDPACALELREAGPDPARLAFCAMEVRGRTPDLVWAEPYRVEYTRISEGDGEDALVRIREGLSGEVRRETNIVLRSCASFRVEFGDGAVWHAQWPAETGGQLPRLARVTIQAVGEETPASREFWLPVGHSLTSRLVRSGSVKPAE